MNVVGTKNWNIGSISDGCRTLRRLGLLILFLVMSGHTVAQGMPVYDNTNFVSLVKQLVESAKQTSQLIKTVDFLKQQKENLEKVNNVLNQLDAVSGLIANQQELQQMVQNDLSEILSSPYITSEEADKITASFQLIVDQAQISLDYVQQILSSDFLKMDDGQRAEVLQAQEERSRERVAEVEAKTRRYKQIISFRKLQDKVNNREAED